MIKFAISFVKRYNLSCFQYVRKLLTNLESQCEKKFLKVFFIKNTGTPLGPDDLEMSSVSITLVISLGIVGDRKNDEPSGLMKNLPSGHFFLK